VSLSQSGTVVATGDAIKPRFLYSIDVEPGTYQLAVSGAPPGDSCPGPKAISLHAGELAAVTIHCLS
jgi:hypothetical protein